MTASSRINATLPVLPMYVVTELSERSYRMGYTGAVLAALSAQRDRFWNDPLIGDLIHVGLIEFGGNASETSMLGEFSSAQLFPSDRIVAGAVRYDELFRFIRQVIDRDLLRFRAEGREIRRPVVFLIAGSGPGMEDDWAREFSDLVEFDGHSGQGNPSYPLVTAVALGPENASFISKLSNPGKASNFRLVDSSLDIGAQVLDLFDLITSEVKLPEIVSDDQRPVQRVDLRPDSGSAVVYDEPAPVASDSESPVAHWNSVSAPLSAELYVEQQTPTHRAPRPLRGESVLAPPQSLPSKSGRGWSAALKWLRTISSLTLMPALVSMACVWIWLESEDAASLMVSAILSVIAGIFAFVVSQALSRFSVSATIGTSPQLLILGRVMVWLTRLTLSALVGAGAILAPNLIVSGEPSAANPTANAGISEWWVPNLVLGAIGLLVALVTLGSTMPESLWSPRSLPKNRP